MIGILTFHRAHNYGSSLQSYALKTWLNSHGYRTEIVDFYPEKSMELYRIVPWGMNLKDHIKSLFFAMLYLPRKRRYEKFKKFQEINLSLSARQYRTEQELRESNGCYTAYITGSDQIWNMACFDFSISYYLDFVKDAKRISYAPSFGPIGIDEQNKSLFTKIKGCLENYDYISVRDEKSADIVEMLLDVRPSITVDPTLLLDESEWNRLLENTCIKDLPDEYIFFYSLKHCPDEYEIIRDIATKYKLPVVITNVETKRDLIGFKWIIEAGPLEYLYLIKNAKMVVSSSFHGTVFSVIFKKLFFSINGLKDNRIRTLLSALNLQDRCIDIVNYRQRVNIESIDYQSVNNKLLLLRKDSEKFLSDALN